MTFLKTQCNFIGDKFAIFICLKLIYGCKPVESDDNEITTYDPIINHTSLDINKYKYNKIPWSKSEEMNSLISSAIEKIKSFSKKEKSYQLFEIKYKIDEIRNYFSEALDKKKRNPMTKDGFYSISVQKAMKDFDIDSLIDFILVCEASSEKYHDPFNIFMFQYGNGLNKWYCGYKSGKDLYLSHEQANTNIFTRNNSVSTGQKNYEFVLG